MSNHKPGTRSLRFVAWTGLVGSICLGLSMTLTACTAEEHSKVEPVASVSAGGPVEEFAEVEIGDTPDCDLDDLVQGNDPDCRGKAGEDALKFYGKDRVEKARRQMASQNGTPTRPSPAVKPGTVAPTKKAPTSTNTRTTRRK